MARMGQTAGVSVVDHSWIDGEFPGLTNSEYKVTSEPSNHYNCIAYAAGKQTEWWSHLPGYYWPASRSPFVESLMAVFSGLDFEVCDSDNLEYGFEKVAIYSKGHDWTHAARQRPDGRWQSKLGNEEDIEFRSLDSLIGDTYGKVYCIMRKRVISVSGNA